MNDARIWVGDEGTQIETILIDENGQVVNLSGAITLSLILKKPDGTILTKAASPSTDGTDGKMNYVTTHGDLDLPGVWEVQAAVALPAGKWHSTKFQFTVYPFL